MKFSYMALSVVAAGLPLFAGDTAQQRLTDATSVLNEVMATPDKGIPQDLLEKAHCIVIVPGVKQAAFIVGTKFDKGFATCRRDFRAAAPVRHTALGKASERARN